MEPCHLDALQSRLFVLERRLRAAYVGGVFTLIVLVLLVVAVQRAASQATIIRARIIELVDSTGHVGISMAAGGPTGAFIYLNDAMGHTRISMHPEGPTGTFIQLADASGKTSLRLDVDSQRGRVYAFFDTGAESTTISAAPGNSYISAQGAQKQAASLRVAKGIPSVEVYDLQGKASAALDITKGNPEVRVVDDNGYSSVLGSIDLQTAKTGTVEKRSGASLVLLDKDGKVIWSAP